MKNLIKQIVVAEAIDTLNGKTPKAVTGATQVASGNVVLMAVTPQIGRVLVRYLSAALVTGGVFSAAVGDVIATDADLIGIVTAGVGVVVSVVVESKFFKAIKEGK